MIYSTNWQPHGREAEQAIEHLSQHLDHRLKSLRDEERNRRILSGFLAVREGPFDLYTTKVPKADQPALRDAVEGLTGPVLKRVSGHKNRYRIAPDALPSYSTKVKTIGGDNRAKLETRWGAIYTDNSFDHLPFEAFGRIGYAKPQLVEIIAPHHHWGIFFGETEAPSRFWHELDEVEGEHPQHDKLMDYVVERAGLRGVHVLRYRDNGFICGNHQQFVRQLDNNIARFTNTSGRKALLRVTDEYGRTLPRPGASA